MKNKYVIISVAVVAAFSLGSFFWQIGKSGEHQAHVERPAHTDGEQQKHDTHDHDEHSKEKSNKPAEHAEHDEHAAEEGEEGHGEEIVLISYAEMREFGVTLATAQSGTLNQYIELPGEIVLNSDRVAHVVPRVAGIAREVRATVGDRVEKGQLLAVLESRELADAKASYLAAIEREKLAQANFQREERLWEKR